MSRRVVLRMADAPIAASDEIGGSVYAEVGGAAIRIPPHRAGEVVAGPWCV